MPNISRATIALSLLAAGAQAETTLIFGEAGPDRGARAAAIKWFAAEVEERSQGDLKIDLQWGGALFKANGALQAIRDGVADMGTIIAVYFPKEMAGYGIADLPLDNPDAWAGMRATDALMRESDAIRADLEEKGLAYIGTFTTSAVNIGCKDAAIRTSADVDGLKVRGVGAYGKAFGELGATLVNMSIYKAYQGLDTGLIDCSQGYSYAVAALKQTEVMTSYTLLDWGQIGGLGVFMNADMRASLTDAQRDIIDEVGMEMADRFGQIIEAANAKALEAMRSAGVEIIELPAQERATFIAEGAPYIEEWTGLAAQSGLPGEALLARYRELIAQYTAERDEKGYPWMRE